LKCANKFYNNKNISIPKDFDYTNFKKEKKKTFHFKYNDEPLELSQYYIQFLINKNIDIKLILVLPLHLLGKKW
jgi:hypothetical protein